MARFGVTYRTEIRPNWTVDWLRDGKDFNKNWDYRGDTLRQLYAQGADLSISGCVLLMCGTTGELQQDLTSAYNAGVRTLVEGNHKYLWVFDARRKIILANKTVTVMKIFHAYQYYSPNSVEEQAREHGWRLAQREGLRAINITDLRDRFLPAAKAAWG